jgi:hypothetical protein
MRTQAHGQHAEQQAETEGGGDGGDQADVVLHPGSLYVKPVQYTRHEQ